MKVFFKVVGNIDKVILFEDTAAALQIQDSFKIGFFPGRGRNINLYWNFFYLLSFTVFFPFAINFQKKIAKRIIIFILFDIGDLCPEFRLGL